MVFFYREHRALLEQIGKQYGVAPQYIVAIVGVETSYGRNTGKYKVLDALVGQEDRPVVLPRLRLGRTADRIEDALLHLRAVEQRVQRLRALAALARHLAYQFGLAGVRRRHGRGRRAHPQQADTQQARDGEETGRVWRRRGCHVVALLTE